MISANEALSIIRTSIQPLQAITVSLKASLHHILAEPVVAGENVPSFDNSSMDGFALRAGDVLSAPLRLRIAGGTTAGGLFSGSVRQGECISITTGARIPDGCDAVVQSEWTERDSTGEVTILRPVPRGHNIRRAGSDVSVGARILEPGTRLRAQEIGLLAALGIQFVQVFRRPSVAIVTTGNELREIDMPPAEATIRDANRHLLRALLSETGIPVIDLGIARDDRNDLEGKFRAGLRSDMLVTSGGVSVGEHDLVAEVLKSLGVAVLFWKVNIKPGMPMLFGVHGRTPVFGLPGNPVSAMITFLQFVRPALSMLMGGSGSTPMKLKAALLEPVVKNDGKRHFVRGVLGSDRGILTVRPTGAQTSHMLSSLTLANCLIVLPEETPALDAGAIVDVEMLG